MGLAPILGWWWWCVPRISTLLHECLVPVAHLPSICPDPLKTLQQHNFPLEISKVSLYLLLSVEPIVDQILYHLLYHLCFSCMTNQNVPAVSRVYDWNQIMSYVVTLATLVRMTVPVTDKKCPTSLDLGIVCLVSSGHTGKPENKCFNKQQKIHFQ